MNTNDTCPHCGAERRKYLRWTEASDEYSEYMWCECPDPYVDYGSTTELKQQLAAQAAEIERLKADNKHLKVSLHKLELLVEHRRQSRGEVK
jgi:hypothetical protein